MLQQKERGSALPTVFSFNEHSPVRTILIDDQPWFAAIDVCESINIKNARDRVVNSLDDDERRRLNLRRQGSTWFVNESGLYAIILGSTKPEARRFRKWITNEVLPTLRRKGSYSMTVAPDLLGLNGIIISGHPYYDYLELLTRLGCSTTSGSKDYRRRRNPQEFCTLNDRIRVSGNFSGYIMRMARIRKEQAEIRDRRVKYMNQLEDKQVAQLKMFQEGARV